MFDYLRIVQKFFTDENRFEIYLTDLQTAVKNIKNLNTCDSDTIYNFLLKYLTYLLSHLKDCL